MKIGARVLPYVNARNAVWSPLYGDVASYAGFRMNLRGRRGREIKFPVTVGSGGRRRSVDLQSCKSTDRNRVARATPLRLAPLGTSATMGEENKRFGV
jgi:hypothetical protein